MRLSACALALLSAAQPVLAGGRMAAAPVIEPVVPIQTPVLAAPSLVTPTPTPTLSLPPVAPRVSALPTATPAVARPAIAAAPAAAVAAPAVAAPTPEAKQPPVLESLASGVRALGKSSGGQTAAVLHNLFTGSMNQGAANAVAEPVSGQVPGRSGLRLLPAGSAAPAAEPLAGPRPLDSDGSRMSAALRELEGRSDPGPMELGFAPSPASLKAVADNPSEVFLYRERATGAWRLSAGKQAPASGDYDLGLRSARAAYPRPADLVAGAGKDARLFVVSAQGVAEWNPVIPFPDEPARLLGAGASPAEAAEWSRQFHAGSFWRRLVMNLTFPAGYPTLARSLGVAMELKSWKDVSQGWLLEGKAPESWATLAVRLRPALAREADLLARRFLGRPLSAAEAADVAAKTSFMPVTWRELNHEYGGMFTSHPDGIAKPDLTITLAVKAGFGSYASVEEHFQILFAHEYTHRLQYEGAVSVRHGVEIPAVAVELLRALELTSLETLRGGRISFIGAGVLASFEDGRRWAQKPSADEWPFFHKGFLAGAAHALAARTGRPGDAWEFVRRVESARAPENPAAVFAAILGR